MKKKLGILLFTNLAVAATTACASPSNQALDNTGKDIYWVDASGAFVHDSLGHCVQDGSWSAAAAKQYGCAVGSAPAPVLVSRKVSLKANALFDVDKADLKPAGKSALDRLVSKIAQSGTRFKEITVTGHTDSTGTAEYNQKLSERRAQAVKAYLVDKGVKADRIVARGVGDTQPVASNKTAEGRSENRRVEIDILAQQTTRGG